jgi:hypothetical protein
MACSSSVASCSPGGVKGGKAASKNPSSRRGWTPGHYTGPGKTLWGSLSRTVTAQMARSCAGDSTVRGDPRRPRPPRPSGRRGFSAIVRRNWRRRVVAKRRGGTPYRRRRGRPWCRPPHSPALSTSAPLRNDETTTVLKMPSPRVSPTADATNQSDCGTGHSTRLPFIDTTALGRSPARPAIVV